MSLEFRYSNNKYFGYSMDYQKRKIYNTNIIQGFEIWNIKPKQEYLDNNFFVLTEYNHAFKIVSNKIFIGTEIRHELFQLYKVPGL